MPTSTVELRNLPGTQAAVGRAEDHTLIVDRPEGRAGGMGLGFNGAQLLGLAIGGCFANDLRYVAAETNLTIDEISISVSLILEGTPARATSAEMHVSVALSNGADPAPLMARAKEISTIVNSLTDAIPVAISSA